MPLTDTAIRNVKPSSKPIRLFDERGLCLEVAPAGGKWWRFKYHYEGKEKRISLGTYSDVSLKDARAKRDEARKLLADGIDPGAQRTHSARRKKHRGRRARPTALRSWPENGTASTRQAGA